MNIISVQYLGRDKLVQCISLSTQFVNDGQPSNFLKAVITVIFPMN